MILIELIKEKQVKYFISKYLVREKSKVIVTLLEDRKKLKEERENYAKWKNRIEAVGSDGKKSGVSSSNFTSSNVYGSTSSDNYGKEVGSVSYLDNPSSVKEIKKESSGSSSSEEEKKKQKKKKKKEESSDSEEEEKNVKQKSKNVKENVEEKKHTAVKDSGT